MSKTDSELGHKIMDAMLDGDLLTVVVAFGEQGKHLDDGTWVVAKPHRVIYHWADNAAEQIGAMVRDRGANAICLNDEDQSDE